MEKIMTPNETIDITLEGDELKQPVAEPAPAVLHDVLDRLFDAIVANSTPSGDATVRLANGAKVNIAIDLDPKN